MKVQWTASANQDRAEIYDFIRLDNARAAARLDQLFSAAAKGLAGRPRRGRPGRVPGTRELLAHEQYFLVYTLDEDVGMVSILAVLHTSRQWPPPDSSRSS